MGVSRWIERTAALAPAKTAIRFAGRDVSYGALAAQVDQLAAALAASGVRHGGCVAYLGLNSPENVALLFACARLGALFMPLNWRLAGPEHQQMLQDCPPAVLFVEGAYVAQTDLFRARLGAMELVAFGAAPPGWIAFPEYIARGAGQPVPQETADPATPLLICYTSGSTGKPKGVLLTQDALDCNADNSVDMHGMTAADVILTTLPLFHVGGLNNQTTPALREGCTVVLHPKFDAEATFDAIEREGVTLTVLVPAQLDMMMASPRWQSADFSRLRMIATGSTIITKRLADTVHARGVPLVPIYGATETCPIAAYLKPDEARPQAGSTGRAAAHCELRVVDSAGMDVAPGVTGDILVRGRNVMCGYWQAPEATTAVMHDGWFNSGDMGHLDAAGYLYVDGRRKEMIISGGENIYPAEIENVLIESPDIAEVAIVGRADARWGELVVAVVAPMPGRTPSAAQVLQLLDGRIARYKHPKDVVFVASLPKSALGKVRKDDVRQMIARQAAQPTHNT
ncbi:MAG: AMP-binding protein [Rhodocyclales bacterium]|nr:AMP-binding protein [Rhodocyclales bacterium]